MGQPAAENYPDGGSFYGPKLCTFGVDNYVDRVCITPQIVNPVELSTTYAHPM